MKLFRLFVASLAIAFVPVGTILGQSANFKTGKALEVQYNILKELNAALDEACKAKYADLTIDEIKELLINRKWYYTIFAGIKALYVTTSHEIAGRVSELAERYEDTLPSLEDEVESYEAKVKAHLERMGFVW